MASFDRPTDPNIPISPWIARFTPLFPPSGRVLDLAAGHGRHARHFLKLGFDVTAVDIDVSNLGDLTGSNAQILEADLEGAAWPFADLSFGAIIVCNYLHRPHFPLLINALGTGGVLLFDTFGQGNEIFGRPRNPNFLLAPGELLEAFSPHLRVVAYEHGHEENPRPAVRQRLCAVKIKSKTDVNDLPEHASGQIDGSSTDHPKGGV